MSSTLPIYESRFYLLAWAGAIFYSIYKVSLTNAYFSNYQDIYSDFDSGWPWINRRKDVSDHEWAMWMPFLFKSIPLLMFHQFISQSIKVTSNKLLLYVWYIFSSSCFLCYMVGGFATLCILVQPILLHFATYSQSTTCIWIVHILFLFVIHFLKTPDGIFQNTLGCTDDEHYILVLTMCWVFLRSISYDVDIVHEAKVMEDGILLQFANNLLQKLAYCLYLPTLSLGPLITYTDFMKCNNSVTQPWGLRKLKVFILNSLRYTFWMYFTEFSLHFVYVNAMQYHPQLVQELSPWALYGLGYCMGQFFLNKYVIVYGINGSICALDDLEAPPQPKCIARIHLYSDMWKYFDRGLYKFLVRYIYAPVQTSGCNKLLASFLCFTFIFLWHGMQNSILIWALLNFVGLTIEGTVKSIGRTSKYIKLQNKYLSPRNARRFTCALTSPLLAMSAVSNFYFFAGREIGDIYMQRIFHESWQTLFILLFFMYCCCQFSIDVKNWEEKKSLKEF